jgi:hypothetical protein
VHASDHLLEVMRTGVPYVGRDQLLTGPVPDTYWTFLYAPLRSVTKATAIVRRPQASSAIS